MGQDSEKLIELLIKTNQEQEKTIEHLHATIRDLQATIANLNETLSEFQRKLEYLSPITELLHQELLKREVIHADEVPCQALREKGRSAASKSYLWIYLSGTGGKPPVVLYDYQPGRNGDYPIRFPSGFHGMIHCDGFSAYGRIEEVVLVCCLAHCRRKFFEAIPSERRRKQKWKLLDIHSEQAIAEPRSGIAEDNTMISAEKGATASAIVLSLVETAKANKLNIHQYLYTLLLYMPDYKNEPAGIEQLLPWSDFIKERCSGITNLEKERPENRGNLRFPKGRERGIIHRLRRLQKV